MDHGSFDRFARLLGSAGSRRAALGALLGTGFAGTLGAVEAAKKDRSTKRKSGKKGRGKAQVSAQAVDCLSPGHGSNISGCDYTNDDFSGQDLSSSRMVGTIFRNADLVETDLSSSNAKNANFRDADMCGADLRSSTLGGANFRDADLTLANLKSSGGCNTANFTAGTTFCGTVMCDGSVRNDDCTGGPASDLCCTACDSGSSCVDNACECDFSCPGGVHTGQVPCGASATCETRDLAGGGECGCFETNQSCLDLQPCGPGNACDPGFTCAIGCCGTPVCAANCGTVLPAARRAAGGKTF